jgi:excisionase family DNA binding protein
MQHGHPAITIDDLIEDRVERAVQRVLTPYIRQLAQTTSATVHDGLLAPEPLAYTVKQAASMLGVSRGMLYQLIATGELRSVRLGSRRLVLREAIVSLLAQHEANATA